MKDEYLKEIEWKRTNSSNEKEYLDTAFYVITYHLKSA